MNPQVRLLQQSDIARVADMHRLIFPHSRSTSLGKRYVRKMFTWFFEKQPDLSFVCEYNGEIIGYVIGAVGGYGRKLFRYAVWEIVLGLFLNPKLWMKRETFKLWRSYLQSFHPAIIVSERKQTAEQSRGVRVSRAALAGIGIVRPMRGKGISKLMVQAFEQAAKSHGACSLGLSVELDNLPARRLYEKCGWQMDSLQPELNSAHYSKEVK